jgi:hypothetical protein
MTYRWSDGKESHAAWCRPTATPPQATGTGADLTLGGSIATTATFNELVGIQGQIDAQLHAGYRPLQRPRGQLDAKVTASISGCAACIVGSSAPNFTLAQGTLYDKVFATWGNVTYGPCSDLANTSWEGTWQFDPPLTDSFGTWTASFDSDGTLIAFNTDVLPGTVTFPEVDCDSLTFTWNGFSEWSASFDATRTYLDGTFITGGVNTGHWSGIRL